MSYNQHKLNRNNQKMMDCEWPLGMIYFSLILNHNMGMKYAEKPFNMGTICFLFFLHEASFKMGTFSDPQHTHPGIFILESPHPLGLTHMMQSVILYTA